MFRIDKKPVNTDLFESMKNKRNKKSIIFMLTSLDYGGAQTQVVSLAMAMQERGWRINIISMLPPKAFIKDLTDLGIEVHTLGMRRGLPDPRALFRLVSIIRKFRPAILHTHMVHANLLGRIARSLCPVPVLISTAHSMNEGGRLLEFAYRLTDSFADITTNVSHAAATRFVEIGAVRENRIRVMANGVNIEKFQADSEVRIQKRDSLCWGREFVWIAVGRLDEAKNYPNMLHAFRRISNMHETKLVILGTGPLQQEIEALINSLGVQHSVQLLGDRDDVPALLNAADAYVMSSAWEGLPMVLLEAAACELPIVCTDVGGNREIVTPGESGLVVSANDSNHLSQAMLEMMAFSNSHRAKMGREGRRYVEARFSLGSVVEQWEKLYWEFLPANYRAGWI